MEPPQPQLRTSEPQHYSIGRYNHRSHRGEGGGPLEMTKEASLMDGEESSATGERRGGGDMHRSALDRNLASLRDHVKLEGFNNGVFSDVVLKAMGSTYHLHRLLLSRSSYFRNMLQGPWKEASSPVLILHVDDKNVNSEAMEMALAYLYGYYPKLNDENAFRVLAAASFLDLQDLCAICTDFIIAELWSSNFLTFQVFAESQDYGSHGERVRNACWGYLCQSGSKELKEVLPKLSSQTLHALLTSDALWVPSEEKRFELAVYSVLANGTLGKAEKNEQVGSSCEVAASTYSGSSKVIKSTDGGGNNSLNTEQGLSKTKNNLESHSTAHNNLVELADHIVDSLSDVSTFDQAQTEYGESNLESGYNCNTRGPSTSNTFYAEDSNALCSYINIQNCIGMSVSAGGGLAMEGPSDEDPCYQLNSGWPPGDQMHCVSINASCNVLMPNEWERCNVSPLTWGGRTVGRREVKSSLNQQCGMSQEDYDSFVNIFEGGSLLYCNMSFEALLDVRKHLEEMGFPCKAVNDGLWLQMLLNQRVQEIGADTCKNCCCMGVACACRQSFGYNASGYYIQDEHSSLSHDIGHVYINHPVQGERTGHFRPVRVHDRGPIDGLAGIGRGATFVTATAWPPTRYVFSRVPFGIGNRGNQPPPANDEPENRGGNNGDFAGDGLTALVGLSQGSSDTANVHEVQIRRDYEMGPQGRLVASLAPSSSAGSGIPVQIMDSAGDGMGIAWENSNSSISLDMKTPLNHFPPFRFAVEFQDVHRLCDGQVKHSPEAFYAGSLWKVSVQAFSDEDPQGRRTLGLFLHRRKAEISDPHRKVHMYADSREKVTARYQLICPSKREVMVFGSYKQNGTLLPKAPKGWGWRTALLFDELDDLLQNGALRIAAVVQLI